MTLRAVLGGWLILWIGAEVAAAQPGEMPRALQARAVAGGWIESEGLAQVVNITPEEARARALQDARERAIMFGVGIEVQAHTLQRQEESDSLLARLWPF